MTMARRGYGCRIGTPVVEGTGVDLAQPGQGSYAPARAVGTVRLNRFREQMFEHDAKRATQPISVNPARVSECQDRRKTAPSAVSKKPRRFPSLAARFFTICLNSKKSRQVLTRRARATQLRIGCVARLNGTFHSPTANGIHHAGGCGAAAKSRRESKESRGISNPSDGRMWGGWGKPQNPAAPLSAAAGSGRGRYDYPLCKEVYNAFVCRTLSVLS